MVRTTSTHNPLSLNASIPKTSLKSDSTITQSFPTSDTPPIVEFTWNQEYCSQQPFNLSATLASGQNFRWRRDQHNIWWGCIESTIVAAWQAENKPDYPMYWQTFPQQNQINLIKDYFRLDFDVLKLYSQWSLSDTKIQEALSRFRGLRLLRQPPHECLFAFQCATCNTIIKIERSVSHLARHYGMPIDSGLTDPPNLLRSQSSTQFYAFPTLDSIAQADEKVLREGLWGYRASRVIALARQLQTFSPDWLTSLRLQTYEQAHANLCSLAGIGAKLADCICLFALDKDQAVPVDTHVRQIAVNLFAPEFEGKSLTPRNYKSLADAYRRRFGSYAGWAQQYLFFSELNRAHNYSCE